MKSLFAIFIGKVEQSFFLLYNRQRFFRNIVLIKRTAGKVSETGVLEQIFNSSNFNYLPRAMTAASIRQEVIADNIANVNTPNFKKSAVEFEELLARELYGEEPDGKLKLVRTHDKHLPFEPLEFHAEPQIVQDNSTTMRMDKNNVDIDIEMASLTKNQLYYNAIATQFGGYVTTMKNAITSGQQ